MSQEDINVSDALVDEFALTPIEHATFLSVIYPNTKEVRESAIAGARKFPKVMQALHK